MLKTNEALKKTEKIASAAYLITGFFDDKEPLKWDIRNLSSRMISKAVHMKDIYPEAQELLSLFSVAKAASLVSETNYAILSGEISKFIHLAEELPAQRISPGFFDVPNTPLERNESEALAIKDKSPQPYSEPLSRPQISAPAQPKREPESREKTLREFGAVAVKKNSRQSIIINLLKRKKEIMIKDVSPLIEGVSEKTIQRELLAMVDQGIIKKEGEKRWSRYSLAQ